MRIDGQPITRAEWKEAYELVKRQRDQLIEEKETLRKLIDKDCLRGDHAPKSPFADFEQMLKMILAP
jgi:hypothetical protein